MGLRQRAWARRETERLRALLGGKCKKCKSTKNLEFDIIINGMGPKNHHHKMEWSWRISFYRKNLDLNNLQLLCEKCNAAKRDNLELNPDLIVNVPF